MKAIIKRWFSPTGKFFKRAWRLSLGVFTLCMLLITIATGLSIESTWVPVGLLKNIAFISIGFFIASKLSVDPDKVKPSELINLSVKDIITRFLT